MRSACSTPATTLKPRAAGAKKRPTASFTSRALPLLILAFLSCYGGWFLSHSGSLHSSPAHMDGEELGGDEPTPAEHDAYGEGLVMHGADDRQQQPQPQQQASDADRHIQQQQQASSPAIVGADGKCSAHAPVAGTLAMAFRGRHYVELQAGEDSDVHSSELTISMWVRLPPPAAGDSEPRSIQTLLATKASGCEVDTAHNGFSLFLNAWNTNSGQLFFSWGNHQSGCEELATDKGAIVPGRWAFVAATIDAHRDVSLFVDGALVASTANEALGARKVKGSVSPIDIASPGHSRLKIGVHSDGTHYLRGHVASFSLWRRALDLKDLERLRCGEHKALRPAPLALLTPALPGKSTPGGGGGGGVAAAGGSDKRGANPLLKFSSVSDDANKFGVGGGAAASSLVAHGTVGIDAISEPPGEARVLTPADSPATPIVSTVAKLRGVTDAEVQAEEEAIERRSRRGRAALDAKGKGAATNLGGELPNGWPIPWLPAKKFPAIDPALVNASNALAYGRREQVRNVMKRAWSAYRKYAWGADELKPVSNRSHDWLHLGATLVDCLDNLWLMGLKAEFAEAREWVAQNLHFSGVHKGISMFETIIRILGGLLSAFELSKDRIFLTKAQELADKMMFSFDRNRATGLPCTTISLGTGQCSYASWTGQSAVLAEFGTIQLEFKYLAHHTGERKYWDVVERIMKHLRTVDKPHGLYPVFMSPATGRWSSQKITLGALGDSFYEYLIKQWLITNKRVPYLREMFDGAALNIAKLMVQRSTPSGYVYIADWSGSTLMHKMDHLACFAAGMYAVGAQDGGKFDAEYMTLAEALAETCYKMYANTATGLSPEFVQFPPGRDLATPRSASYNIGRPEAVEAWFYMWYYTKDPKWREMGWKVFEAFEKHAATKSGWTALPDVDNPKRHDDKMESFVLAETVKYFYLLFDPDADGLLEKYVFNTEAHPLGRFDPMEMDSTRR